MRQLPQMKPERLLSAHLHCHWQLHDPVADADTLKLAVVAAMFVSSALALQLTSGPTWLGLPLLAVIGLALSALLGLWLFIAILRSGAL